MMRYVRAIIDNDQAMLALLLGLLFGLLAGCESTPPPEGEYVPLISTSIGMASQGELPAPGPEPSPDGKCPDCNGTGKVGDGTIEVDCQRCGGDGVLDPDDSTQRRDADDSAPDSLGGSKPARVVWHKSTEAAIAASEQSGKPVLFVLVRGFDPWDDPSGREQTRVRALQKFPTIPKVKAALLKFECAWLVGADNPELAAKVKQFGFPCVAVYRPGEEFMPASVSGDADTFVRWLEFETR